MLTVIAKNTFIRIKKENNLFYKIDRQDKYIKLS